MRAALIRGYGDLRIWILRLLPTGHRPLATDHCPHPRPLSQRERGDSLRSRKRLGHEPARLAQLTLVGRSLGHRRRKAVRGEEEPRPADSLRRNLGPRRRNPLGHRLDEARMIVEQPELVDLRRGRPDFLPRPVDVFDILSAAGIRAERRRDERQGSLDAVVGHLGDGIGQHRMPIAIAPVDRQLRPVGVQFGDQRGQQPAVLRVDRAMAIEEFVVPRDFQQPLARHILAAHDVFEKRHHVVRPFGPAERNQQQGVDRRGRPKRRR